MQPFSRKTHVGLAGRLAFTQHALHCTAPSPFRRYTKRTLLLGVYSATELYMLTDSSPGFADTWAALDRRLADVLQLGRAVRGVASLAEEAGSLLAQLAGGLNPQRGGGGRSSGPSI